MRLRASACCLLMLAGTPALAAPASYDRAVRVGGEAEYDACGSVARVVGLNPRGDNFLAVKSGPDLRARRTDKLGPEAMVFVCDSTRDGAWTGIVYDPSGEISGRCGVTSPIASARPYRGPCQSGWVATKYLKIVAG